MPLPLALTMGDPSGIGGEIAVKAWAGRETPVFFCIDDPARLSALGAPVREVASPAEAAAVFADALPVMPERLAAPAAPGAPDAANAPAVIRSIERAVATTEGRTCSPGNT